MPQYYHLRFKLRTFKERMRATQALKRLRAKLDKDLPAKDSDQSLLLSTWNIRDFGKSGTRRGFGRRLPETWFYIAEIISRFDMVAVQEVGDLDEWNEVMDILGPNYDFIASDITDRSLGGNGERLLFVFDKRKVHFQNIAGEIVLPTSMLITGNREGDSEELFTGKQFRRTPYVCAFQAGWFKFSICTVHIYYGSESGDKLTQRVEEIEKVAQFFAKRADEDLEEERALILLGDFNIVHPDHKTMQALNDQGFTVPEALKLRTNFKQDKFYDQIAFKNKPGVIEFIEGQGTDGKPNAGFISLFDEIMRPEDFEEYSEHAKASPNGQEMNDDDLKEYFSNWKTYQLSDHFPLWARIDINSSDTYLDALEKEFGKNV
ncbi:MAG: endonuclease/exonuclease/phosphatase family protein [Alphaproteobacteria bacterium]